MPQLTSTFSRRSAARWFGALSLSLLSALPAWPFGTPIPIPEPVLEYYNTITGHYFMTASAAEMADIAAGSAGPGWAPTGWSFDTYANSIGASAACPPLGDCPSVRRFYSSFSNSHFFTADPAEAQGLENDPNSEWKLEPDTFSIPVPDANGQCTFGGVPVYRLYNNRFAFHDSNHRF